MKMISKRVVLTLMISLPPLAQTQTDKLEELNFCLASYKNVRDGYRLTILDQDIRYLLNDKIVTEKCLNDKIRGASEQIFKCYNDFDVYTNKEYLPPDKSKLYLSRLKTLEFCESNYSSYQEELNCLGNIDKFLIDTESRKSMYTTQVTHKKTNATIENTHSQGLFELCKQSNFKSFAKKINSQSIKQCVKDKRIYSLYKGVLLDERFISISNSPEDPISNYFGIESNGPISFKYQRRTISVEDYENNKTTSNRELQLLKLATAYSCENDVYNGHKLKDYHKEFQFRKCVIGLDNELKVSDREGICASFVVIKDVNVAEDIVNAQPIVNLQNGPRDAPAIRGLSSKPSTKSSSSSTQK